MAYFFTQEKYDEFKKTFEEVTDHDGEATVNFAQFLDIMARLTYDRNDLEAFKKFDKDGSGKVTTDDLKEVLKEILGRDPSEEEVQKMLDVADKDGNGKVDFQEFLKVRHPQ